VAITHSRHFRRASIHRLRRSIAGYMLAHTLGGPVSFNHRAAEGIPP
jgi:hypothetical protein